MAKLRVEIEQLEKAAAEIDNYLLIMAQKMNAAQGKVNGLSAGWQGSDYTRFSSKFNTLTSGGSTYAQAKKTLDSYAGYLRYASQKYREAQNNAVARANKLPK